MALDVNTLFKAMSAAGEGLAGTMWHDMQTFALPELQKIATQIVAIEAGLLTDPPHFSTDEAKGLLDLQVQASVGIIVAMTTLTLLAVQTAINQILAALKGLVNAAVKFPLIA